MFLFDNFPKFSKKSQRNDLVVGTVQNLLSIFFLKDELHISIKRKSLEISEYSSFFQLFNKNKFKGTLKIRFFIDISWKYLNILIG